MFSKQFLLKTYLFSSICYKPFNEWSSDLQVQERVLVLLGKISQSMMFPKQKFLIFIRSSLPSNVKQRLLNSISSIR